MGEIYIATNTVTGRRYVGQTKYYTSYRWNQHLQESRLGKSQSYLHRAIRKYGEGAFVVRRVLKNIPEDALDRLEIMCIHRYNTLIPNGYNMCRGGVGVRGYRHTEATKRLLSAKFSHTTRSADDIEKIKAGQRAHDCFAKRSKNMAWRKAISEGRKGKYTGLDNPFGGKHHTPETKARISEANSKAVLMCDTEGKTIKRFNSLVEARDYLIGEGITTNKSCQTPISKCCRGVEQRKSCYGFVWKYEKV